ncbi:hypothetical protein BHE74_00042854 [Ensete ventricosum]|nr:hypothetical protein BHE74_00042854 [Ensete ventricosum]
MDPGLLLWPFYRGLWGIEAGIGLFEGDLQPLVGSRLRRGPRMSAMWQAYTPVKVSSDSQAKLTRGDGGLLGTTPYLSCGAPINSSYLQAEEVGQCLAGARRRAEVETFQMALELRLALRRAKEAEVPMEEAWDVMNVIEDEVVETVAEANKQVEVL